LPAGWREPRTGKGRALSRLFVLKRAINGLDRLFNSHKVGPHVCLVAFVRFGECLGQLASLGNELLSRRRRVVSQREGLAVRPPMRRKPPL